MSLVENHIWSNITVADIERNAEIYQKQKEEEDKIIAGDQGGRGVGPAAGHLGSQSNSPQPPVPIHPDAELAGAGDDSYGGYDPGMAGCNIGESPCHIPGLPSMGVAPLSPAHANPHMHLRTASRGYERDDDEYDASTTNGSPDSRSVVGAGGSKMVSTNAKAKEVVTEVAGVIDPAQVPLPDEQLSLDPGPTSDTARAPGTNSTSTASLDRPEPPSIRSRFIGRVERLAGKVFRDPHMEARGKRHMTGQA